MQKKFIHIVFSLVLSTSILTPVVVNFLNGVQKHQLISDLSDDENKTEDYTTDFEIEKFIFLENFNHFSELKTLNNKVSNLYIPSHSDLELKIVLPPPEHNLI